MKSDIQNTGEALDSPLRTKENGGNIVCTWQDHEYIQYERGVRWYIAGVAVIGVMLAIAFFMKSAIMAVTFILLGVMVYVYSKRDPRIIDFRIRERGIEADGIFYDFRDMKSFWIFIGINHPPFISIRRKKTYLPYLYISLGQEDPMQIGGILGRFIPEKKQEERFSDTLERVLKL